MNKVRKGTIQCSNIDKQLKSGFGYGNNMLFEDTTTFLPNRYKYSEATAKLFIRNYVNNGSVFQSNYIKHNASDGITLKMFDEYK